MTRGDIPSQRNRVAGTGRIPTGETFGTNTGNKLLEASSALKNTCLQALRIWNSLSWRARYEQPRYWRGITVSTRWM